MKMQTLALFFLRDSGRRRPCLGFHLSVSCRARRKAEKRMASVARAEPVQRARRAARRRSRREQVEASLKELDVRNSKPKTPAAGHAHRAGRADLVEPQVLHHCRRPRRLVFMLVLSAGLGLLPALGFAFAAGFGLPFWLLGFLKKRRENQFLNAFPDAVDVIVRGIKAGLPLLDSLHMIAAEAPGAGARANSAPSSRRKPSACRSAKPAPSSTSACRCRKRISSAS